MTATDEMTDQRPMLVLLTELDDISQRFIAACWADDASAAHDAYHAALELMIEHRGYMREDLRALSKRMRLRKEGR